MVVDIIKEDILPVWKERKTAKIMTKLADSIFSKMIEVGCKEETFG